MLLFLKLLSSNLIKLKINGSTSLADWNEWWMDELSFLQHWHALNPIQNKLFQLLLVKGSKISKNLAANQTKWKCSADSVSQARYSDKNLLMPDSTKLVMCEIIFARSSKDVSIEQKYYCCHSNISLQSSLTCMKLNLPNHSLHQT